MQFMACLRMYENEIYIRCFRLILFSKLLFQKKNSSKTYVQDFNRHTSYFDEPFITQAKFAKLN